MLSFNGSLLRVNIPLFLWETVFNCGCLRLYSDGSTLAAAVVEDVVQRVPIVLYDQQNTKSTFHCNIVAVAENVSSFEAPKFTSFINLLLTAEHSNNIPLHRFSRKIFYLVSGITNHPVIHSLNAQGELEVISENRFKESIDRMLLKSLDLPNFNGKNIFISVANHTVYSLIGAHNGTIKVTGFEYDTIDFACKLLNLTKVILPASDVGKLENGSVTGIVADVVNDRTDVGVGGIWLNAEMALTVEFINPHDIRCGHYLITRPRRAVKATSLVFMPFEENLWVTVGVTIVVESVMKTVFARIWDENCCKRYESFKWSFYETVMNLILRYYPVENENKGVMKPLFVSWSWLSFILTTIYASQLAAILVTPHYEDKPVTIEDFFQKGYYWGGPTAAPPAMYQTPSNPTITSLWRDERFLSEESVEDRNNRMKTGNYVLQGESLDNYFLFSDEHMPRDDIVQNYEAAGECYDTYYSSPIFPQGSPYSALFNRIVYRVRETGIKKQRKRTMLSLKPMKEFIAKGAFSFTKSNKTKGFTPVNLSLVKFPFLLLAASHCVGIFIFIAQHLNRIQKTLNATKTKRQRFTYNN